MSDDQLLLFLDIPRTPRKPKSPVGFDLQASPPEVTLVKAAPVPKQQQAVAAKKRQKGPGKASAKPRVSSALSELLTVQEVARHCTVSRATIWRWVKAESGFPKPLRLARGTTRWLRQDVVAWLANRAAARSEGEL